MIKSLTTALRWTLLLLLAAATGPALAQIDEPPTSGDEIVQADFFREGAAPVRAPANSDVTIVYFFDYQCPACRKYTPDVERVLGEDRRVKVIYRDTPIFGPRSELASDLAIASRYQGRHQAFHHQLMMAKLPLDDATIRAAADKAGVDWARLQRDLATHREEISLQVARNLELHTAAGISGTPAFIVKDRLADGALDYAGLKAEIADARASNAKQAPAPTAEAAPAEEGQAGNSLENVADAATNGIAPQPNAAPPPIFKPSPTGQQGELAASTPDESSAWPWVAGAVALLALIVAATLRRRRTD